MKIKITNVVAPILVFVAILLVWQSLPINVIVLPKPYDVAVRIAYDISVGTLTAHTLVTLQEILIGFALSSIVAVGVGVLVGEFKFLRAAIYPYIIAIQATPVMAIAPFIIIVFGYGLQSKIIVGGLISFFPMLTNTVNGLNSVNVETIDLMHSFMAKKRDVLVTKIRYALPFIFTGLETSIVVCVVGVIVGEFVGSAAGLGYYIMVREFMLDSIGIFSAMFVLTVIGIVLHSIVRFAHKKIVFWEGRQ